VFDRPSETAAVKQLQHCSSALSAKMVLPGKARVKHRS
jgi:hypothetical protein